MLPSSGRAMVSWTKNIDHGHNTCTPHHLDNHQHQHRQHPGYGQLNQDHTHHTGHSCTTVIFIIAKHHNCYSQLNQDPSHICLTDIITMEKRTSELLQAPRPSTTSTRGRRPPSWGEPPWLWTLLFPIRQELG